MFHKETAFSSWGGGGGGGQEKYSGKGCDYFSDLNIRPLICKHARF